VSFSRVTLLLVACFDNKGFKKLITLKRALSSTVMFKVALYKICIDNVFICAEYYGVLIVTND